MSQFLIDFHTVFSWVLLSIIAAIVLIIWDSRKRRLGWRNTIFWVLMVFFSAWVAWGVGDTFFQGSNNGEGFSALGPPILIALYFFATGLRPAGATQEKEVVAVAQKQSRLLRVLAIVVPVFAVIMGIFFSKQMKDVGALAVLTAVFTAFGFALPISWAGAVATSSLKRKILFGIGMSLSLFAAFGPAIILIISK